jgi:hypothetical protein
MPTPHQLTIDVLDAFGSVTGTAVVKWADVDWSAGAIDEVHRVFAEPTRIIVPPALNDSRMRWSLSAKLA